MNLLGCILTIIGAVGLGFCLGYRHRVRQAFWGGYRALGLTEDEIRVAWQTADGSKIWGRQLFARIFKEAQAAAAAMDEKPEDTVDKKTEEKAD